MEGGQVRSVCLAAAVKDRCLAPVGVCFDKYSTLMLRSEFDDPVLWASVCVERG